ncbi:MAG: copper amine oxidase N-terminal domain-containing protein [Desulfotomaculales bacterium]
MIAGAKVIQVKVGSQAMIVNGASVTMDTAPELVPPGRVCLPIGWLAWALGAKTSWDNATQTATLEL